MSPTARATRARRSPSPAPREATKDDHFRALFQSTLRTTSTRRPEDPLPALLLKLLIAPGRRER